MRSAVTQTQNTDLNQFGYLDLLIFDRAPSLANTHAHGQIAPIDIARPRSLREVLGIGAPGSFLDRLRDLVANVAGRSESAMSSSAEVVGSGGGTEVGPSQHALDAAKITMEELVREHADAVYRVALSVTRDPVLAEDASQEALIKAWQALPSFRGESPVRHWILRITHNVSISLLRRRREDVISPLDLPDRAASDVSVERQVQDRLAIDRFESALSELDGISRSIVVLREVEGLSYAEMSDVLELPLPTIRTRLLRARRQLADALDGWQP